MKNEILNVEFEVEKTVNREHGFQEKSLRFRGGDTRYKGIVKDNQLVAILGRNYKLIPNEDVVLAVQKIGAKNGYMCGSKYEGWKLFEWIWSKNGKDEVKDGVIVVNSVDGTVALKCIAITSFSGYTAILVSSRIQNIMRRHTKKAVSNIDDLEFEINTVMAESTKYGEWLSKMGTLRANDHFDTLKVLFDKLPKVYVKGLQNAVEYKTFGDPTVKDIYECVAKRIWSADLKMVTKMAYYRLLNDVVFVIAGL